jgi:hypothetical protein
LQICQYVRVVKEADSKSAGVTRTGSNPVADVFYPQLPSRYFPLPPAIPPSRPVACLPLSIFISLTLFTAPYPPNTL